MNNPVVSVVIPFYSNLNWLEEALESVEKQDYPSIETLLIDDGSNLDLEYLSKKYKVNLHIYEKENGGPASARNMGIEKSKGKYLAFLDSDDIWLPGKLRHQIDFMEKKNSIWSQHSYEMFWEDGTRKNKLRDTSMYEGNVLSDTYISFRIQTSCVIVRAKELKSRKIFFPTDMRYGEDNEFYKQLAKHYPLDYVKGYFSGFRIRGTNAGFRAEVQLKSRAHIWNEINVDNQTKETLPKSIVFAYKLSHFNNLICSTVTKTIKNEKLKELIYKLFYTLPYLLFKKSAK